MTVKNMCALSLHETVMDSALIHLYNHLMGKAYTCVEQIRLNGDLVSAIEAKNLRACVELLHQGASPNLIKGSTHNGESALLKAALTNKKELVDLVWAAGGEFSPYEQTILSLIPRTLQKREENFPLSTKERHAFSLSVRLGEASEGFRRVKDLASGVSEATPESLFEEHNITFDRELFTSEFEKYPRRSRLPETITADQIIVGRIGHENKNHKHL